MSSLLPKPYKYILITISSQNSTTLCTPCSLVFLFKPTAQNNSRISFLSYPYNGSTMWTANYNVKNKKAKEEGAIWEFRTLLDEQLFSTITNLCHKKIIIKKCHIFSQNQNMPSSTVSTNKQKCTIFNNKHENARNFDHCKVKTTQNQYTLSSTVSNYKQKRYHL